MILVVSDPLDVHARAVAAALRRRHGHDARFLDLADFPRRWRLSATVGRLGDRATFAATGRGSLRLDRVRTVWWRRPSAFGLHAGLAPGRRDHVRRQCREAVLGVLQSTRARWVNDPMREEAASHKVWQLALAGRTGLAVPATIATSDPARARAFLRERRGAPVVYKPLGATPEDWTGTRLLGPRERANLAAVRYAPVLFQEYVEGVDLRVTLVGRRLFAAEIDARGTSYPVDYRIDYAWARVAPVRLPPAFASLLRRYVDALGLAYAAIDLRRRPSGEHLFLEVNPSGQWLFVEERTGQPITEAVAALLARR